MASAASSQGATREVTGPTSSLAEASKARTFGTTDLESTLPVTKVSSSHPFVARPEMPPVVTNEPGTRAVVIVRVAMPWYAPRFVVRGKFRDVLAEYEEKPTLEAKYFSISDDSRFGGLYLWRTRADAEKHFDAVWFENVRRKRGVEADVLMLAAPYVIDGRARLQGELAGSRSLSFPASASFVTWKLRPDADVLASARRLAESDLSEAERVRTFVVRDKDRVGLVSLFATREAAERCVSEERRADLGKALSAVSSEYVLFETPLLVDRTLRDP